MLHPSRRFLLLALLLPPLMGAGKCSPGVSSENRVLVVYNTNADPDASTIASHYAVVRGVAAPYLCPVALPVGLYASPDELLGARRTLVEECLCGLIPEAERPDPCDVSNLDAIRTQSTITHLALVKGIPARLTGTVWPTDSEEPSFDFYLSYLVYRGADIFAPGTSGLTVTTYLTPELIEQSQTLMILSAPPLDPTLHKEVAYGRIEAIDTARTLELIDRTLEAEQLGLAGNFLEEKQAAGFAFLQELTGSHAAACTDYISHEPFLFDTPESSWPPDLCRAGTTFATAMGPDPGSSNDDPLSRIVPGSFMSTIPRAVDVSLFLGSAPWANLQSGFNSFDVLENWRLTDQPCTPLCADLPSQAERDACRVGSSDYFRELNSTCVGVGRGLLGQQVRSWPVQYYGFMPPGWTTTQNGAVEKTPAAILTGGAYQDARFGDDRYLHLGHHGVADPDQSSCSLADGSVQPCPERLALDLSRRIDLAPALPVAGTRSFRLRLRHRNPANPAGALRAVVSFHDGATSVTKETNLSLGAESLGWSTDELLFAVDDSELSQLTRIDVGFATRLSEQLHGFLDLDGLEFEDLTGGAALLDVETGSFDPPAHDETHPGDWAANAIDRLGAVAWWGSSSHHLTGGWAFSEHSRFYGAFFMGRTLGESLLLTSSGASGIVYGDPLYRPVAVRIHLPGYDGYGGPPGLAVSAADLPQLGTVLLNVLHGTAHATTVRWTLSSCPVLDPVACDQGLLFTERASGTGSLENHPLDWTGFIDPGVPQDLLLRLRVWNPGEEVHELFHHAYFSYSP